MNSLATLNQLSLKEVNLLRTMQDQRRQIDEKHEEILKSFALMNTKIKHAEELSRSYKAVLESNK